MTMPAGLTSSAPHIADADAFDDDLVDWGVIPTMIEGESRTSGKLLFKGADGHPECGL